MGWLCGLQIGRHCIRHGVKATSAPSHIQMPLLAPELVRLQASNRRQRQQSYARIRSFNGLSCWVPALTRSACIDRQCQFVVFVSIGPPLANHGSLVAWPRCCCALSRLFSAQPWQCNRVTLWAFGQGLVVALNRHSFQRGGVCAANLVHPTISGCRSPLHIPHNIGVQALYTAVVVVS